MRVLVCGGRNFADKWLLWRVLNDVFPWSEPDEQGNSLPRGTLIHGACPTGADALADEYAVVNWLALDEFPADWRKHGKAAGPIRNQHMIDTGRPDVVVAFRGGRGTADLIRRAEQAGIRVIRTWEGAPDDR
jgi:hypothetical protein